jgi:multiple sugar transport system ATP-binding protein
LDNIKKVYEGGFVAVHGVSLEVKDREFVVLVGPSGCGKSTTLRMIAGLEEVTEGTITIGDRVVNDVPPKDRDIAMVFQNYALYPHMSVYDNMAFGLKLRKYPKGDIDQRVREAAGILGIEDYLSKKPKVLSGGQRQRVAVGRAIVRKPQVFLFDEPLSNLDAKLRVQMRTEISRLHHQLGTTMIYVTHDQTEAMTMGDKIVLMKDGFVQQIDSPLNIYHNPANKFVAGFIGSPAMNFYDGTMQKKKGGFVFQSMNLQLPIPKKKQKMLAKYLEKKISLGIRPEHITRKQRSSRGVPISVPVEVVEPMGNEIYVYFSVKGNEKNSIARIDASSKPAVGKMLDLSIDMEQAHYFDAENGNVIR